ncbi:MAG: diacylglycerol kinase family protein [Spirulina sp. SIO3F2]|nr:diacylglycerol kinase family protein [Spirulina sp. SIO3F2]
MSLQTPLPSTSDFARTAPPLRITMPKPTKSDRPKFDRHFAWKVAPNLWVSFRYAWAGLSYAFRTQRNFRVHTAIALLAVTLGFGLHITTVEMAIVGLTCALVMVLELINTAIESVVDLTVQKSYHDLAKVAKDCAAGAVLVSAIVSIFIASLILLPPLVAFGQALLLQLF